MFSQNSHALTNPELRGRTILLIALVILTVLFLAPPSDGRLAAPGAWIEALVAVSQWLLIFYFAFLGGSFSLGIIRFALVLFGTVSAIAAALSFSAFYANKTSEIDFFSARAFPLLLSYGILGWTFFLSPSARAYVQQRQTQGYRLSRISG